MKGYSNHMHSTESRC